MPATDSRRLLSGQVSTLHGRKTTSETILQHVYTITKLTQSYSAFFRSPTPRSSTTRSSFSP